MFGNNDIIANPIYHDGIIYLISHSGTLAAYKKNPFENLWSTSIGSSNTPVVSGKTIFTLDNLGNIFAMDTKTGKLRCLVPPLLGVTPPTSLVPYFRACSE